MTLDEIYEGVETAPLGTPDEDEAVAE